MSSGNRQDKPLSSTPAGMHRRFTVLNSVALVLLIPLPAVLVVSNRRRQMVNREMLLLMRDQFEQLKSVAPGLESRTEALLIQVFGSCHPRGKILQGRL